MKRGRAQWLERRRYAFPLKGITQLTQAAWFHLKSERELLEQGYELTARALVALISKGDPDWDAITYG